MSGVPHELVSEGEDDDETLQERDQLTRLLTLARQELALEQDLTRESSQTIATLEFRLECAHGDIAELSSQLEDRDRLIRELSRERAAFEEARCAAAASSAAAPGGAPHGAAATSSPASAPELERLRCDLRAAVLYGMALRARCAALESAAATSRCAAREPCGDGHSA